MKTTKRYIALYFFPLFLFSVGTQAAEYQIDEGMVTVTDTNCSGYFGCNPDVYDLSGSVDASVLPDTVLYTSENLILEPDLTFQLSTTHPDTVLTQDDWRWTSNGVRNLLISGTKDNSAVDGLIYDFQFRASEIDFVSRNLYFIRPDLSPCAEPQCGGVYIKPVNQSTMQCPDGEVRAECRILGIQWNNFPGNPFVQFPNQTLISRGVVEEQIYEGYGNVGKFISESVFRPATNNPPEGTIVRLRNLDPDCTGLACQHIQRRVINSQTTTMVSRVDLNPVGATNEWVTSTQSALEGQGFVYVAGTVRSYWTIYGRHSVLYANQIYRPIAYYP